jgi:basic membrane lipoprotein Med (substrate-binding protein (PBP1-ABC) superfamily)
VFVTVFEAGTLAGADRVLTSAYVDLGGALTQVLSAYAAGQPPTGALPLTLANAGVVLAPYRHSEGALSPLDVQDVEQARLRLAERSLETGVDPLTGDER